ncbi:SICA antigen [Plasmodium coatneyi]|uniref:SICA antigen n=1 Tax=Plasmodium coatneyi TaxID=208452 RepID=A0A1B1DUX7_9APIC|nr:SICA antigen [Plasmodium coatneyi]ANQ06544.1 SICA antigen [Plasmodium coatneyi]
MAPSIREFIKFQMEQMKKHGEEASGNQLWTNLKKMLDAIPNYMYIELEIPQTLCNGEMFEQIIGKDKKWSQYLCKALVKIFLWMNGRNQHLGEQKKGGVGGTKIDDMELMFRCIAGNAAIWAMFGDHCQLNSMIDYATEAVSGVLKAFDGDGTVRRCGDYTFKDQKVGTKLLGTLVKDWLNANKNKMQDYLDVSNEQSDLCKEEKNSAHGKKEKDTDDNILQTVTGYTGKEMQEVGEIVKEGKFVSEESAKEIIEKVEKGQLDGAGDIEKVVQQKVQEDQQKKAALSTTRTGDDCKERSGLCDRVKCVTEKWFPNRSRPNKRDEDWNAFWTHDVNNQLISLSGDMLQEKQNVDNECNNIGGVDSANKKACQFIVKGLKHIYGIQRGTEGSQQMIEDNLIFHRTMSCVLLNAYADKLLEHAQKHNPSCDVEEGIKKAFEVAKQNKSTWCVDKSGGNNKCEVCSRDGSYKDCEIGNSKRTNKVKDKVNELFEQKGSTKKDQNIEKVMEAITNICPKAPIPKLTENCDIVGLEEDEDLNIGEWFTRLNNNPIKENDGYYDWEWWSALSALCEDSEGELGVKFSEKSKEFCKLLIKNLLMATGEKKFKCEREMKKPRVNNMCITRCDLFNLWLIYANNNCAHHENVEHVYKAMMIVESILNNGNSSKECELWKISNINRNGADLVYLITESLMCKQGKGKLGEIHEKNWCRDESKRTTVDPETQRPIVKSGKKSYEVDTLVKDLKDLEGNVPGKLQEMQEKVKEVERELPDLKEKIKQKVLEVTSTFSPKQPQSLSSSNNDCNKKSTLCDRVKCVSDKWHQNKGHNNEVKWSNMREDINKEATKMFGYISTKNAEMRTFCSGHRETSSRIVTDPEKKACQYITAGLKHIYEIQEVDTDGNPQDNRFFKQTMSCLLLNAYADKLEREVKSPCTVGEQTIQQAFEKGNKKISDWCKGLNGQNNNCEVCDRVKDLKNCTVGNEYVKAKVDSMLHGNKDIEKTLSTISNLCDRAQCKDSWDDIKGRIDPLAGDMLKTNSSTDSLCDNIKGDKDGNECASKEACRQIVRGLKHIYEIQEESDDGEGEPKNNRLFKQTMACLILNEYGKLLGEKSCIDENTIKQAFQAGESLHKTECKGGAICQKCEWDDCTNFKIGQNEIDRPKIKGELKGNTEIQKTLEKICPKDTKPPDQINTDHSTGGSSSSGGSRAPTPASAPPAGRAESSGSTNTVNQPDAGAKAKGKSIPVKCEDGEVTGTIQDASACFGDEDDQITAVDDDTDDNLVNVKMVGSSGKIEVTDIKTTQPPDPVADADVTQNPSTGSGATGTPSLDPSGSVQHGQGIPTRSLNPGSSGSGSTGTWKPGSSGSVEQNKDLDNVLVQGVLIHHQDSNPFPREKDVIVGGGSGRGGGGALLPLQPVSNKIDPSELLTPYLPTIPVLIGTSVVSYLLWKYFFFLRKKRRRYGIAHEVRGPAPLEVQLPDHVDDQDDGPHEYTLVKERRQPRSLPTGRRKQVGKGTDGRGVGRRTIIDIHLEVLDECQKGDLHSTKEDFFEILVQEFMGCRFIKGETVPEDEFPTEHVPSSDSWFREKNILPKGNVPKEQVQSSDCGFREEDFVPKEEVPMEQVPSSDFGFREERLCSYRRCS